MLDGLEVFPEFGRSFAFPVTACRRACSRDAVDSLCSHRPGRGAKYRCPVRGKIAIVSRPVSSCEQQANLKARIFQRVGYIQCAQISLAFHDIYHMIIFVFSKALANTSVVAVREGLPTTDRPSAQVHHGDASDFRCRFFYPQPFTLLPTTEPSQTQAARRGARRGLDDRQCGELVAQRRHAPRGITAADG